MPTLGFWFGGDDDLRRQRLEQYLVQHPVLETELQRWAPALVDPAVRGKLDHMGQRPYGRLALVLLLDVMPRILYRGDARAYSGDLAAQGHLLQALAAHQERMLSPGEQLYFYLPFMHAEDLTMQDRSVKAYSRIALAATGEDQSIADRFLTMAREHYDIVKQYGRFPDRNHLLHRFESQAERVFLLNTDRIWFAPQPVRNVEVDHDGRDGGPPIKPIPFAAPQAPSASPSMIRYEDPGRD